MSSIYNTPYTYLIGWSKHNIWYYGLRYAKNCHPSDLWNIYFTSSKYVKETRLKYGEPDIVEIRKTFETAKQAQLWEHKVLRRMNVVNEQKWLNRTDNKCIDYNGMKRNTIPGSLASAEKRKGKTYEEYFGEKEANRLKELCRQNGKNVWLNPELAERMKKKPADRSKYKAAALKRWSDPEDRAKRCAAMKGSKKKPPATN